MIWLIDFGLVLIGATQLIFLGFILRKFNLDFWLGGWVYALGSLTLASCGFVTIKYFKTHWILSRLYFLFISIGALIISFQFRSFSNNLAMLSLLVVALMIIGNFYFYLKKNIVKAEFWSFVFCCLWAIVIYSFI